MTVTDIPGPTERGIITWPTEAERLEALAVGMADYNVTQILLCPEAQVTFHARYALRWGARPEQIIRAFAAVVGRPAQ